MNKLDAKNKDAALNIYADLCEVRNYTKVTANLAKEIGFIYFEACPKLNDTNTEFIFPTDEFDSEFNLDVIYQLVAEINDIHKPKSEINKIKVGITSSDFTTVYYDFTLGVDSPFNREQLKRESNPLGN